MCYTEPSTTKFQGATANMTGWPSPFQCACGCIGHEQTAIALNHYKEHLKAELKHVETRICQLEGCDQGKCDP